MKKTIYIIIAAFIIIALVILGTYMMNKKQDKEIVNNSNELVGGQTDEHGCLGPAGYSWCEEKQKCLRTFEEFCADSVASLVSMIAENTGVILTYEGNTDFRWLVTANDQTIGETELKGVAYTASSVKQADYIKIENYLNETTDADNTNIADGVQGGLRGYLYNYMACALNFSYANLVPNAEGYPVPESDSMTVKLECGFNNPV